MFVVCLDPGHGGRDPGAVGNGLIEKEVALSIALKVHKVLEADPDVKPVMTYHQPLDPSIELGLGERCNISDRNDADCFVSIHCNSFGRESAHGSETFFCPGSANGSALARSVQKEMNRQCPEMPERRVAPARFYVLTQTAAPAALVECGFVSNEMDAKLLGDEEYQERCAAGIAAGIMSWLRG